MQQTAARGAAFVTGRRRQFLLNFQKIIQDLGLSLSLKLLLSQDYSVSKFIGKTGITKIL